MKISIYVWDWPLRLFHWLLVVAVVGAYVTGKLGGSLTDWHGRFGGLVLGLLVFRLLWGVIGGIHARFVHFFPTPARLTTYFKGQWQGHGHNPAGALAVIALLFILGALVATGLYANDDIAFEGPLFSSIDKDLSDKLSGWHISAGNILLGLVSLHVLAILFHHRVKKNDLVTPMLTGKKQMPKASATHFNHAVSPIRFYISLLIAVSVVWGIWNLSSLQTLTPLAGIEPVSTAQKT